MTTFKIVLIVLQLVQSAMRYLEKQGIINDEQKREYLRQLQLAAVAGGIKEKHKAAAEKLNEQEIDIAIGDDFRDDP